ncbi:MAG: PorV/PorQ family protein [Elusimicrobia bacterium]|nr:PorV/PorQ family protein [Candidatus Obscuribacterium magneticum]
MKRLVVFIFSFSLVLETIAGSGKSGLGFLSLGNGARATGMGEAQTALAEGANAIYWNPAGLGLTPQHEVSLTHLKHFEDSSQQYAGLAIPIREGQWGGLGLSVTRFAIENIEVRDAMSTRQGTVEQEDLNLQLSYGVRVGRGSKDFDREGLYIGGGVKRVSEDLGGVSASAVACDLGLQYRPGSWWARSVGEGMRRTSFGGSLLHIGKGPKFDQEETPFPQVSRVGLGYTHFLWGDAINLGLDYEKPKDDDGHLLSGAEFWVKDTVAFRVGYKEGQDVGQGLRAGAGFKFQSIQLDYAWAGFGETFGDTHRFTLNLRFGGRGSAPSGGLKSDLVRYHLSRSQEALSLGLAHEAILEANHVLEVDPRNPAALQLLTEAGEKIKPEKSLPEVP